jgi:hypothetical protein
VWWRAQIRAKQEAARKAGRPISVAQVLAGIVMLVLAGALYRALSESLGAWWERAAGIVSVEVPWMRLPQLNPDSPSWWIVALVVGAWLVLTPVAIYFAVSED